ncbi:MAG: DUF1269 domain-containing protein, partial [Gammaproteobacteria bacterium]
SQVEWGNIHLVAREGIELEELPEATVAQKSDLFPAVRQSAGIGAATGAVAGSIAIAFPPAGLTLAGGALLLLTAAGAGFGAWVGGMIGISMPNRRLAPYQEAIRGGELLMMVDLPMERGAPAGTGGAGADAIEAIVRRCRAAPRVEPSAHRLPVFP